MPTATEISERDRERETHMLHSMCEAFFQRWAPQDRFDQSRFHADFHNLVRSIHADAARPFQRIFETSLAAIPFTSIIPVQKD